MSSIVESGVNNVREEMLNQINLSGMNEAELVLLAARVLRKVAEVSKDINVSACADMSASDLVYFFTDQTRDLGN